MGDLTACLVEYDEMRSVAYLLTLSHPGDTGDP